MGTSPAGPGPQSPARSPTFERRVPEGDDRPRLVCGDCGFVNYENPKLVVGSVVEAPDGRILLCRRAIEPRRGYWTLPAGFLELNETPIEGAMREAHEEACARIEIDALLGIYSVPRISQVQLIYRARLAEPEIAGQPAFAAGPESLEVALYRHDDERDEIPWDEVAFPSVHWALAAHRETRGQTIFVPRVNLPGGPEFP